jgi:hypothetical protein
MGGSIGTKARVLSLSHMQERPRVLNEASPQVFEQERVWGRAT